MMAGGALVNALAFTGSSYLFRKLSSSDEERKRHDLAMEKYEKDHIAWSERRQIKFDQERKRRMAADRAEKHMQELDQSMVEYARALDVRDPEPQLFKYYHPSEAQKRKDYGFAVVCIALIGGVAYYVL